MMFTLPLALKARTILETGLHVGNSTRVFLQAAKMLDGHVYTVDVQEYPETVQWLTSWGLTDRWTFLKGDSETIPYNGPPIDFLYLDSDHAIVHVLKELEHFVPYLSEKAVIVTDDSAPVLIKNPAHLTYKAFEQYCDLHPEWSCTNFIVPEGQAFMWRH